MVQEKNPIGGTSLWKLPGGQVDLNETLEESIVREVKEETGINADPLGVIGFREAPNYKFGKFDIYFVYLLNTYKRNNQIKKQDQEIEE